MYKKHKQHVPDPPDSPTQGFDYSDFQEELQWLQICDKTVIFYKIEKGNLTLGDSQGNEAINEVLKSPKKVGNT